MSAKYQRLLRVLSLLQSQSGVTTAELARACGKDRRTAQRDLEELRTHGYAIEQIDLGEKSPRYRMDHERLSGALLNVEETLALALSISLSRSTGLEQAARTAWDKLHYAVRNGKERVARNELPPLLSARFGWTPTPDLMQVLSTSLVEKRRLRILYQGLSAGEPSWRIIEPWQMFFQERWYLRGRDLEKGEARTFRPDRIHDLELLTETYSIPGHQRSEDPHFHKWDLSGSEPVRWVFQVSPALARWLRENPVHPSQQLHDDRLELTVRDPDALLSWVMGLTGCRILEPAWAAERLRERARALLSD